MLCSVRFRHVFHVSEGKKITSQGREGKEEGTLEHVANTEVLIIEAMRVQQNL